MLVCASCGAENREGARFCDSCGAPLAETAPAREVRKVVTVLLAGNAERAAAVLAEGREVLAANAETG